MCAIQIQHHSLFNAAATCIIPEDIALSKISRLINTEWMNVGASLKIKWAELECIEADCKEVQRKALRMLHKWKKGTVNPCYCQLLSALREYNLLEAVECLNPYTFKKETTA